jgi:leucyl aminopeptidase
MKRTALLSLPDIIVPKTTRQILRLSLHEAGVYGDNIADTYDGKKFAANGNYATEHGKIVSEYKDKTDARRFFVTVDRKKPNAAMDIAALIFQYAQEHIPNIENYTCALDDRHDIDTTQFCIGWYIAAYQFTEFKKSSRNLPKLLWPKEVDKKRAQSVAEGIYLARNLINLPANILGPAELADAAGFIAQNQKAIIKVTKDDVTLRKSFPLVYAVGKGSDRKPHVIDMSWGNPKHKKVTLVGKGVVFDTGGYDLKPSSAMLLMKKDMGGAAMALGLAHIIMSLKLPIHLRVIIPAVENSVSGNAFRPMDILTARNGKTVEIHNTDAEGRLILADCLTLACESKNDVIIDFATLTGAARTALGFDIPALFSNDETLARDIQDLSMRVGDPVWHLPLWRGYRSELSSNHADLNNTGTSPAGAITAALFLNEFVSSKTPWIHIDHYAWEPYGRAGRAKGGLDQSLRTMLAFIEQNFSKGKK